MTLARLRGVLVLDEALVEHVARGRALLPVLAAAVAVVGLGCGAYGVAMGLWRSPTQALGAGIKLPLMFLALAGLTAVLDVVLCGLLRARVSAVQALTASVLAIAIMGSLLGALAPIAAFIALSVEPARGAASVGTSHWLLTAHVLVLGAVGIFAVSRLRGLLDALIPDTAVSRRVLWAWMVTHGVVGAQLSWVLRPFVGNPTLPVRLFRDDAWTGSFFEAVLDMTTARMGPAGPLCVVLVLLAVVAAVAVRLDPPIDAFELRPEDLRARRRGGARSFVVRWQDVVGVSAAARGVRITWVAPGDLERCSAELPCSSEAEVRDLFERVSWASSRAGRVGEVQAYRGRPAP